MNDKVRDIILIVIAAGILITILIPSQHPSSDEAKDENPPVGEAKTDPGQTGSEPRPAVLPKPLIPETNCSAPAKDIAHPLLPLVAGSKWVYHVTGPNGYTPSNTWTMQLTNAPEGGEPGIIAVGFGDNSQDTRIWLDNGAVRFDGLPMTEPIKYLGNRPKTVSGMLFPIGDSVVEGAVWDLKLERDIIHQYRDDRDRLVDLPAKGYQGDRAEVEDFEDITVPVGRFNAYRIFWISRFEIKAKKRQILDALTDEPYRKETMWVVPGIGIVRRKIEYAGIRFGRFSFDLVNYTRPEK